MHQKSKHKLKSIKDTLNNIPFHKIPYQSVIIGKLKKWGLKLIVIEVVAYSLLIFIIFTAFVNFYYPSKVNGSKFMVSQLEKVPHHEYAIVFGAGLNENGTPTTILSDRVKVGLDLLVAGKVDKLIFSGRNANGKNEPSAMLESVKKLHSGLANIYQSKIILDESGNNTTQTCKNAYLNKVRSAILVTQQFHMPRALIACKLIGIESVGVESDLSDYSDLIFLKLKEIVSLDKAIIDIKIFKK